jgi:hypothetical protein
MKKFLLTAIVAATLVGCQQTAQKTECPNAPITDLFMSQLFLKGDKSVTYKDGSYEQIKSDVFEALIEKGRNETMKLGDPLMSPLDNYKIWLTKAEIERKISFVDTQYVESSDPPYDFVMQVINDSLDMNQFMSIRPYEKWVLDDSLKLSREVQSYVTVCTNIDRITGEVRGWEPYFYVPSDSPKGTPQKIATIRYQQSIKGEDSWYRENLEASARQKMFEPIMRKAWDGGLKVYATPDADSFLSSEQLKSNLCFVDTQYIESPVEPYDLQMIVIEECQAMFYDQVVAVEFIQDVYLYENMAISIDVKWYAPVVESVNRTNGEFIGKEVLYWVKN